MNVIFTCGGTAGHINPAIAVANIIRQRYPDSKILFIGAKGHMEEKLVPKAGFDLKCLPGSGLSRTLNWAGIKKNAKAMHHVLTAVGECKKIIKEFQPDVILGTGGYASFPALYAGSALGIPTCVHESNAVPGLTTKMAAKKATQVLVCLAESAQYYRHPERVEVVGMPVHQDFLTKQKAQARQELGLDERPLVVSAFGSLGAKAMNTVMLDVFRLEKQAGFPFQHIHATGSIGWKWMPEKFAEIGECPGIDMREYIYNMPTVMAAADVIIGRAGASSFNEIGVTGTPAILIPSPNVTNNHQEKNARVLEKNGAALVLLENECTAQKLFDTVTELLNDPEKCSRISKAVRSMVVLDAAERIADMLIELARK